MTVLSRTGTIAHVAAAEVLTTAASRAQPSAETDTDAEMERGSEGARGLRYLAWTLLALTEAAVATTVIALIASGLPWKAVFPSYELTDAWLAATFAPFGAIVAARRPRLVVGWLFSAYALFYGLAAAGQSVAFWAFSMGRLGPWTAYVGWIGLSIWPVSAAVVLPLIILLFPDGRLRSGRWRLLAAAVVIVGVAWVACFATDPAFLGQTPLARYIPIVGGAWGRVAHQGDRSLNQVSNVLLVATVIPLALRWRDAVGRQRAQLTWLLWGVTIALVLEAPTSIKTGPGSALDSLLLIGFPVLAASATVALLRYQLLDIDVVVNRTVVYLGLTGGLVGGYLAIVGLAHVALGHDPGLGGSLVSAAVVAVAFAPARSWLQRQVDLVLYGERRDPARALTTVNATLQGSIDDELATAVRAVSTSLRLPHVVVEVDDAQIGDPGPSGIAATELPLRYRSVVVGRLLVWPRRGQPSLTASDLTALDVVAGPLAAAVNAVGLSEALQRSREQIIAAREGERRRLRRDLHDGLGPALTAVALKADAASNLVTRDPAAAHELIAQVSEEARLAITDVRRIAHDLLPAAPNQLGLLDELRQQPERFTRRLDGHPLVVTVDLPSSLPAVPGVVEATLATITAEALTNVARHSTASNAAIRLRAGERICLEIADDGDRSELPWPPGFGLSSMRGRVLELGGSFLAGPGPDGGRVVVELPMPDLEPSA